MPRKVIAPPSAHDQLISMAMTMPLSEISELLKTATMIVKVRAQQGAGNLRAAVAQTARPGRPAATTAPPAATTGNATVHPIQAGGPPKSAAVTQPGAPTALRPPKPPAKPQGARGPRKGSAPPPVSTAAPTGASSAASTPTTTATSTTSTPPEGTDIPTVLPAQDAAEE